MLLVIDNHDSFTFNLVQLFGALGTECRVVRADAEPLDDVVGADPAPTAVVISPGPGAPEDADYSRAVLRRFWGRVPILGVCLGHQCLATVLGGRVVPASSPVHGSATPIRHCGRHLFEGLPNPLDVGRYHSLVLDDGSLPPHIHRCARTADGEVMALAGPALTYGLQFHPESFLTPFGHQIIRNFIGIARHASQLRRSAS